MKKNDYKGALSDLKIIDFGHYYAGPMAGMLLADQGANVIRIIRPGKPELPKQQFRLLNRNKKILTLDLKLEEDKAHALTLIKKADVLIENFRPGVMKRLGLDYASVKSSNPSLVYLSLPGFASTDKERAHLQAWEGILGAAAGFYRDVSFVRQFLGFPPLYTSVPACSMYGGVHGVITLMAALLARESDGCGTVIEVPLVDAGMSGIPIKFFWSQFTNLKSPPVWRTQDWTEDKRWEPDKVHWYTATDSDDAQNKKLFDALQRFLFSPFYQFHLCKDNRHIRLACQKLEHFAILLTGLGIYEKLLSEGFVNISPVELSELSVREGSVNSEDDDYQGMILDNNLSDYSHMSKIRRQRLNQLITESLRRKTAQEWEACFVGKIPCAMVRTRSEWLAFGTMHQSGVLTTMDDGHCRITVPGRIVDMSGPENTEFSNPYQEAENISAVQAEALFNRDHIPKKPKGARKQRTKGELLRGLKVVDPSNGLAGPTASHLLALHGAEVIKVDPNFLAGHHFLVDTEQSKQMLTIDLKTAPGQEVFQRLVTSADVLIHNNLDAVAERLGMSHAKLQVVNPALVTCQITVYGGPSPGDWDASPGFDPIAQSATGLHAHYGSIDYPHSHDEGMVADCMSGFAGAFAVLLGVWQQRKTGYAGEGRTSLVRASNFLQLPHMIAKQGLCNQDKVGGQFAVGENAWQRMYRCKDHWLYIGATEATLKRLAKVVTDDQDADEHVLENAFARHSLAYWQLELTNASIACHPVLGITDICTKHLRKVNTQEADECAQGAGEVLYWENHPRGHPIVLKASDYSRVGEQQSWRRLAPTQACGTNSGEILRGLGYSHHDIKKFSCMKIVRFIQ